MVSISRVIILCAGQGTRLRPLTDELPKCMVPVAGRPLIEWQIEAIQEAGIEDIVLVGGYRADALQHLELPIVINERFNCTNMVYSLWCARKFFGDGFVMAYGDIAYNSHILSSLLKSVRPISVVVDRSWLSYWQMRNENVLEDAESLTVGADGNIRSIGQKVNRLIDIEGQYIGLVQFTSAGVDILCDVAEKEMTANLSKKSILTYENSFEQMYMTDLLQGLIQTGELISPVWIDGEWVEVDTLRDIDIADKRLRSGG